MHRDSKTAPKAETKLEKYAKHIQKTYNNNIKHTEADAETDKQYYAHEQKV